MANHTRAMSTVLLLCLIVMTPIMWSCVPDVDSGYVYEYPKETETVEISSDLSDSVPYDAYYPHHEPLYQHTVTPVADDRPYGG